MTPALRPGAPGRGLVLLALALLACAACAACQPGALSAPGPDASTAVATCENMARVGCALGTDPACASRIELSISEQRVTAAQIACARAATTKPALGACSPYFACP